MDLLKAKPEFAPAALAALTQVARAARAGLDRPQRALVDAIQQVVLDTDQPLDAQPEIAPEELARRLGDPAHGRQLVRFMVAVSVADGPPSPEQIALMRSYAAALGVEEPAVGVVAHLARGNVRRFRLAFLPHAHVRIYFRNTRRILGGVLPVIRAVLAFRGVLGEKRDLAERFRALETLPEESLGYQFFRHCREEGLQFPGEKGGFPIGAVFHDFSHLLAGYDTSPEGEIKNAAFQAGFTRDEDDFFTALFGLVIHTAGINMTPFDMPVKLGRIGDGTLALDTLRALERGARMPVDLGDGWDFWEWVELPIEEVRQRLGVPPLLPS